MERRERARTVALQQRMLGSLQAMQARQVRIPWELASARSNRRSYSRKSLLSGTGVSPLMHPEGKNSLIPDTPQITMQVDARVLDLVPMAI